MCPCRIRQLSKDGPRRTRTISPHAGTFMPLDWNAPLGHINNNANSRRTPTFTRQSDRLFSEEERNALIDYLADYPAAGDEIPGTGGVRKLRFAALGRGKRGGARVIYFYSGEDMPVYALLAYAKSARTNLSPSERSGAPSVPWSPQSRAPERREDEYVRRRPDSVPQRIPRPCEGRSPRVKFCSVQG